MKIYSFYGIYFFLYVKTTPVEVTLPQIYVIQNANSISLHDKRLMFRQHYLNLCQATAIDTLFLLCLTQNCSVIENGNRYVYLKRQKFSLCL